MNENKIVDKIPPFAINSYDEQTAILEAAGLVGVCTDQHLTVIKSFGDTDNFLKNENFNFKLSELLTGEVAAIVKAAAHKALKSNQKVTLNNLNFGDEELSNKNLVNIVINAFYPNDFSEQQLLILFSSNKKKVKNNVLEDSGNLKKLNMQYLDSLEQELAKAKINLETAYELVNASNENVQSFNEELQAANEEMQSSNEELQSVNEELQTINKEQKDTNDELMESNDDLNNYFRSNTNGQLFVDHNMMLKRYSPGAVKHINLRTSDIGRPLAHITTNIKFETLIEDISEVMKDGKTITREAESSEGKVYQVMTMPYIRNNTGETDGAIISFYEITELKKLLSALDVSNKNLIDSVAEIETSREKLTESLEKEKHLNLLKSRFVSMASHEFKTPLTAIQLAASLIGRLSLEIDNPHLGKYTETIKNATKNLTNILNDFLSVELLESGKIKPILIKIDIVSFAEEVTEDMQSLTKDDQKIVYHHTGTGRFATVNPSLLKNSLINLISNAIKYSGPDSLIEFSTKITHDYFSIVVRDNGIGIPKKDQVHLFEAYFRAHNTGNIPGTGLGLNIVGRYTGLMNGKIKFKSTENIGTSFTLTFPIKPIK